MGPRGAAGHRRRPDVLGQRGAVHRRGGPAADRDGNVYFTNIAADQILKWDPATRKFTVFRERSNGANGLAMEAARMPGSEAVARPNVRMVTWSIEGRVYVLRGTFALQDVLEVANSIR